MKMSKKLISYITMFVLLFAFTFAVVPKTNAYADEPDTSSTANTGTSEPDTGISQSTESSEPSAPTYTPSLQVGMKTDGKIYDTVIFADENVVWCAGSDFDIKEGSSVVMDSSAKTITFKNFSLDFIEGDCGSGELYFFTSASNYTIVFDGTCELDAIAAEVEDGTKIKIQLTAGSTLTVNEWYDLVDEVLTFAEGTTVKTTQESDAVTKKVLSGPAKEDTKTEETKQDNAAIAKAAVEAATTPKKDEVTVPTGSHVVIQAIVAITDETTLASVNNFVEEILDKLESTGEAKVFKMDLQATGYGKVQIFLGKEYAGKIAIVGHLHEGKWTTQQCKVDGNGYIDPAFGSFSPITVVVTNETSIISAIKTTEAAPTAPKTGDTTPMPYAWILILAIAATSIVVAIKRRHA